MPGIATCALSSALGAEGLFDCRPIGVGEVIDGAVGAGAGAGAGAAELSAGDWTGACPLELSIDGICGASPLSSSVIAIWKVPSTITTTLAPTRSERIFEVMVEGSLSPGLASTFAATLDFSAALALAAAFAAARPAFSLTGCAAAAACAARRAAAMKLEVLTGSFFAFGISASVFRGGDAIGRRPAPAGPGTRLERMIGRQIRLDRKARRCCEDFADGPRW